MFFNHLKPRLFSWIDGRSWSNTDYTLTAWLFLRGLAIIYFSAFASMAVQIEGLIGSKGILPVNVMLAKLEPVLSDNNFWQLPTLFWIDSSDFSLRLLCYAGMAASSLVLFNILTRTALIACYLLYLSIALSGQDFTAFQWDGLLLETGFLAILLCWGSGIIIFLYRWLIARFMFMGGLVKLASGDPAWANLTALNYHYQTQPLPSPLAYYAYHLPEWFHRLCVAGVFIIELVIPFFVFMPRRFRIFAAWSFIFLQTGIILTGNYTFFNLLTILLCLLIFDDQDIGKILPIKLTARIQKLKPSPGYYATGIASLWACLVLIICASQIWIYHVQSLPVQPLTSLIKLTSRFAVVNNYGPFAIMTTERHEIIIEGSIDGQHWREYNFKYKPGDPFQSLGWNIPHQPRLDWQMWFAALTPPGKLVWFDNFMRQLREGSLPVLALLAKNPFPGKPPRYLRARLYRYTYTSAEQRATGGQIWNRNLLGTYWRAN